MIEVSVLLPVRNAAATLAEALDSLSRQEGLGEDLEILVADDGSTDGSGSLAAQWCRRDPRFRVLLLSSRGLVRTLNTALTEARGNYIARMDADDVCAPDRLQRQLRHMKRHRAVDVTGTGVRLLANGGTPAMRSYLTWQNRQVIHKAMERSLLVECPLTHPTAVFRRGSLDRIGGWREGHGPEDYDLWLRGAAAGWRFGKINRVLYEWRESPGRMTRTASQFSRHSFRETAVNAFRDGARKKLPVLLWGWGRSLEFWRRELDRRGFSVEPVDVNPREIRGGGSGPGLPGPGAVWGGSLNGENPPSGVRGFWLLAYGSDRSRKTMGEYLVGCGFREGRDFRFVS